jgi:hypothetical protein
MTKRHSRALVRAQAVPDVLKGVDLGSIINFLKMHVRQQLGSEASWDDLYTGLLWYYPAPRAPIDWPEWILATREPEPLQPAPPTASEFGAAIAFICNRAGMKIVVDGSSARCLDVAYSPPACSIKATAPRKRQGLFSKLVGWVRARR